MIRELKKSLTTLGSSHNGLAPCAGTRNCRMSNVEEVLSKGVRIPASPIPNPPPLPASPPRVRNIRTTPNERYKSDAERANMPKSATIPLDNGLEVRFSSNYSDEDSKGLRLQEIAATIHTVDTPDPIGKISMVLLFPDKGYNRDMDAIAWDLFSWEQAMCDTCDGHSEELLKVGKFALRHTFFMSDDDLIQGPFGYLSNLEINENWRGKKLGITAAQGLFAWLYKTADLYHVILYPGIWQEEDAVKKTFRKYFNAISVKRSPYYLINLFP